MMKLDETAWREGYAAGSAGKPKECPYDPQDLRSLAWTSGYIEGLANPGTLPQMMPIKNPDRRG